MKESKGLTRIIEKLIYFDNRTFGHAQYDVTLFAKDLIKKQSVIK